MFELAIDRLLTRNLLDREAHVTAEAVRLLTVVDLNAEDFRSAVANGVPAAFEHVVGHLVSISEIIRVKIYDGEGTIVWSDEPRAIGRNFRDNHELKEALEGEIEVEMGLLKAEHVYEAERYDERRMLEIYVPLVSPQGAVYGVFEIYKLPVLFFRSLDVARRFLWLSSLAVGGILILALSRIFLTAQRTEMDLHARARETEAQLLQAGKLALVGQMASAFAHEVNSPLGIIMAKTKDLESMATSSQCPSACLEDFRTVNREIARIAEVVRGILVFARKSEMKLAATDVNQLIEETACFAGSAFARSGITIAREYGPGLPLVNADGNQVKQVVLNLLQNAKDAMSQGGTICIHTGAMNGKVTIEVSDSGKGIPPEIRDRIFDPFFSTKGAGEGAGLGLTVSYGIVKRHGGDIEVSSRVGEGSVFRVHLPAAA